MFSGSVFGTSEGLCIGIYLEGVSESVGWSTKFVRATHGRPVLENVGPGCLGKCGEEHAEDTQLMEVCLKNSKCLENVIDWTRSTVLVSSYELCKS